MYSTESKTAQEVCSKIGFSFECKFVSVLSRNGKIYVKGTCGKSHEFTALKRACEQAGFIYKGKN